MICLDEISLFYDQTLTHSVKDQILLPTLDAGLKQTRRIYIKNNTNYFLNLVIKLNESSDVDPEELVISKNVTQLFEGASDYIEFVIVPSLFKKRPFKFSLDIDLNYTIS